MARLALQADVCYNPDRNIVVLGSAVNTPSRIHLIGDVPMDTLPPHANNGNPSLIPTASGIYKIICTANKKIYIGSTSNLRKRQAYHLKALRQNKHDNPHLQRAFNKYGEDAFLFEVLEIVLLPEMLTAREQYWFDVLKPFGKRGFNLLREAGSPLGWKHTPASRAKISRANLGRKHTSEQIENNRQARLGKKMSPKSSEKKRQTMLGNKNSLGVKHTPEKREKDRQRMLGNTYGLGYQHTPEARVQMSQSRLGRKMSPESIEKTRQSKIGKKLSPEHRAKISDARRGKPTNLGVKRTPEQIENMRQARWGKKED